MQDNIIYDELISVIQRKNDTFRTACEAAWSLIREKSGQEQYLCFFLRDIDCFDINIADESKMDFNDDDPNFSSVKDLERRIVHSLIGSNPSEEFFYHNICQKINDSLLFPDFSSQVSFLTCLWLDSRIPYFQLEEGCLMENEKYQAILEELSPLLKKANFILSTDLKQRTQRASLLMRIAEEINDKEKETVFWAYVLSRTSIKIPQEQILEIIKKAISEGKLSIEPGE